MQEENWSATQYMVARADDQGGMTEQENDIFPPTIHDDLDYALEVARICCAACKRRFGVYRVDGFIDCDGDFRTRRFYYDENLL